MFVPKIVETLKTYNKQQLRRDVVAGVIVGIVALPLAIAFAIASGVSPEKGLFTAIIAGFIISAFGGSRVQIGGPTGAFIVIVYGIVQQYGISGLIISTFLAGIILMVMGFARFGSVIKFVPYPLIVGFTSGIAVIIFSSQIRDIIGLDVGTIPADFLEKWKVYFKSFTTINNYAAIIGVASIFIILLSNRVTRIIPGSLVAIVVMTVIVQVFHIPVDTIGTRFGNIPSTLPLPIMPDVDWATVKQLIRPAFTIALLGCIESLLSAVVADGMIGGNHKSNVELVAQGAANIASAMFGGLPATGAIARTATNIKNGGRTPVAGIVHSITLLIIMLALGRWATLIPMCCLAAILVVVAYNMSEPESFFRIIRGNRGDAVVLICTFLLTVLVDLTVAIEIGMLLAMFLFMRTMMQISKVNLLGTENKNHPLLSNTESVPEDIEIFELTGPFFFAAAYKFKDAIKVIKRKPKAIIVDMSEVPVIDATGLNTIKDVLHMCNRDKITFIISGIQPQVFEELKKARLLFKIGKRFVTTDFEKALQRAKEISKST
jgi:SulP family sulfate permease